MIINNTEELTDKRFKVIIVGSGIAGISIATRLEKYGIESLVIEAGDYEFDDDSNKYLKVKSIGDHKGDFTNNRVRQFGGSSLIWGGNCNPMSENNFLNWPISKATLDEYLEDAKKFLKLKNDFFSEKINQNFNIYNLQWSKLKIDESYLDIIKKSKFIHLSLNTTFLDIKKKGRKIVSISCKKNEKKIDLVSNFLVLATGGIENSRLLLWLRQNHKNFFDDSLPIGKYYMHHPFFTLGNGILNYKKLIKYYKNIKIKNYTLATCESSLFFECNNSFLNKYNILNSGIYIKFSEKNSKNFFDQLRCVAPKYIKKIYDDINSRDVYQISLQALQEQMPLETNHISLGKNLDPNGIPLAKLYWKRNDLEMKSIRLIMESLGDFFIKEDFGRIALEEYIFDEDLDFSFTSGNHQMGGTRIGFEKKNSVVDKNLRVHGIENLFIAGSSVFSSSGHCHPTLTVVQLSLRLGDKLMNIIKKLG